MISIPYTHSIHYIRLIMNLAQFVISTILKDYGAQPISKLLAIRVILIIIHYPSQFAKDTIQVFNDNYISQFQNTVLPLMEEIAYFRKEKKDEDRGKFYFSVNPNKELAKIGNSFFRLTLDCLWVWSKWFPIDPNTLQISNYKLTLEKLIKHGVKFSQIVYFTFDEISQHIPEQQVPIKVLKDCRQLIEKDILDNKGKSSPTKTLCAQLFSDLRKEIQNNEHPEIFYGDKISSALNKEKQNQEKFQQKGTQTTFSDFSTVFQEIKLKQDDLKRKQKRVIDVYQQNKILKNRMTQNNIVIENLQQKCQEFESKIVGYHQFHNREINRLKTNQLTYYRQYSQGRF